MSTSFPRLKACVALLMALVASAATTVAQIPVSFICTNNPNRS